LPQGEVKYSSDLTKKFAIKEGKKMATGGRVTGIHNVMTGKRLADRWQVLDPIGGGGMGIVYRGFDLKLKAPVAIKVLNPELRSDPLIVQRFAEEVNALKRSAHPNIAIVHDFSIENEAGIIYLVLEFLDGQTLKTALDESPNRRLHLQRVRRIFPQMLDALAVVHERGIVHRDLKPENVFLLRIGSGRRNTDVVKLIDFGIAKFRSDPQAAKPGLTQAGTVLGTPFYMSPEQCRGEKDVDSRTDLYAVGVMLYEAVTGQLPFNKATHAEIMVAHLNDFPDAPKMLNPEISPELEMVIFRALAKNPGARFQDAVELSDALEAAIPEDKTFYRDSQRVSPVNGSRPMATPPRVPAITDDQPTTERPDVSKTPTRLLAEEKRPQAGIALAKTITPTDLKREAAKARMNAAIQFAKNFGVWILAPSRRAMKVSIGSAALVIVGLILLATLLPNGGKGAKTADAGADAKTATVVHEEKTPPRPMTQPDVAIGEPVPVPTPANDAAESEPKDAGTAEAETPEAVSGATANESSDAVETASNVPPSGYADLLESAKRARNWRTAVSRLEEATRLWPEGPDAWEALGDTLVPQRGQTERARTAYTRCLESLPPSALTRRATVEGKIRGLR
jgi:serine/threonine-protein kinase